MIDFKKKYEKYKYKYYNLIKLEKNKKMQGGATSESLINVFGVTGSIGLFAIIAAIIYFLFNKKKKKDEDEEEDMIQLKYNIADKETKELTHSANSNIDINNDSYNIEQKELLEGQLQDNSRRLQEFEETLAKNKEDTEEVDDILDKEERLKRLLKTASEKEEHQRIMKDREELLNKFKEFKINMAKDQKTTDQETSPLDSSIEEDDDNDDANDKAIKLYNKNVLKKAFEILKSQDEEDANKRAIEFYNTNTLQKTIKKLKSPKEDYNDANEKAIELYKKNTLKKIIKALETKETQEDETIQEEDKTIQEEDEPKISENIKNKLKKFANKIRRNLAITKQIQEEKKLKLKLKALQKLKANKENKQLNENEEFVKRLDIKQEEDQQFIEQLSEDIDEFTESDINDELDALRKKEKEEEEVYRMEQERLKKEEEERLAREQDRLRREKEERLKREKEEERLRKNAEEKIQKIAEKLQKQRKEYYFKKIKEEEQKKMQYNPLKQCILDNLQKEFTELIKYKIEIVDYPEKYELSKNKLDNNLEDVQLDYSDLDLDSDLDSEEPISPISPSSSSEPEELELDKPEVLPKPASQVVPPKVETIGDCCSEKMKTFAENWSNNKEYPDYLKKCLYGILGDSKEGKDDYALKHYYIHYCNLYNNLEKINYTTIDVKINKELEEIYKAFHKGNLRYINPKIAQHFMLSYFKEQVEQDELLESDNNKVEYLSKLSKKIKYEFMKTKLRDFLKTLKEQLKSKQSDIAIDTLISPMEPLDLLEETSESRIIETPKIEIADDNFKISLDKSIFECLYEKLKEKEGKLPNKCPEIADMEDFINDESVKKCDLFNRKNFQIENFGEEDPYDVRLKTWILEKQNEIESNIIKLLKDKEELNSETRPKYVTCLKRLLETIISMYKEKMSNSSKNKSITNVKTSPEYESSDFGGVVDNLVPGYYDTGAQKIAKGNYDTDTQKVAGKS